MANKIVSLYIETVFGAKFTTDPVLLKLQNIPATRWTPAKDEAWDKRCKKLFDGETAEVIFAVREEDEHKFVS